MNFKVYNNPIQYSLCVVGIFIRISTKLRCLTQIKDGQIALASPFLSFNHRTCTHGKVSISATSRKLIEIQFSIIIIVVVNVIFDRIKQGRNTVWPTLHWMAFRLLGKWGLLADRYGLPKRGYWHNFTYFGLQGSANNLLFADHKGLPKNT